MSSRARPIIRIENPELIAKYRQSEADLAVAQAELARVNAGFRAETIAVRKARWSGASADLTLAQQTYERKRQLAASHDAPMADLDKATAELAVANVDWSKPASPTTRRSQVYA